MSKLEVSYSNKKLNGGNVMIFNMNPASSCPADALGMCPLGSKGGDGKCYALKSERMYKQVLPYRRRQEYWWDNYFDPEAFVNALRKKTEYFRFSEAGDMRTQEDVDKMALVCDTLSLKDIKCYGYTRRIDLDLRELARTCNLVVADTEVDNCSCAIVLNKGEPEREGWHTCPGKNCMTACRVCAHRNSKVQFHIH